MPTTTLRAQSGSLTRPIGSLAGRVWRDHRLFVIVLVPAILLRFDAEIGYRWQLWFNDSFDYIQNTVKFQLDPTRVSGYTIFLKVLEPFRTYAIITILQHLMGVAVAVMIYALARHRFGVKAWLAALATVPVLYDGFEIQLEHLIMADVPFLFVLTLALTLLLWTPKPSLARCLTVGFLLGLADVLRSVALPLLVIFALYMIIRWFSWKTIVAMIVACALPVVAYAGGYYSEHGSFAMNTSTGDFIYARTMTFAECDKMGSLPPELLPLCTTVPPAKRPEPPYNMISQSYIWTNNQYSPLFRYPSPIFSKLTNQLAKDFAIRAIEAQPLDYLRAVWGDTWRVFDWKRVVYPNAATYDEYLFTRHPIGIPSWGKAHVGPWDSYAAAYVQGNPYTHVVQPFAGWIKAYQRHVYLPGTLYGFVLLIGLGGLVLAWRRWGGEALLPWGVSVALIVIPAATATFDYRYVLVAVPYACLAAAMAFAPGTAGGRLASRAWARLARRPSPDTTSVTSPRTAPSGSAQ